MPLPTPNLDDRRFQGLVDDAKRMVQQRCPEWTDHNVSDPGVTLIETMAFMVDQLIYRLNRVPDLHFLEFLNLIGVRRFPPTPARLDATFWLSAPQPSPVVVPAGTEVATPRGDLPESSVAFTTTEALDMVPCELSHLGTITASGTWRNHTDQLPLPGAIVTLFSAPPEPGEVMVVGLSVAVPRCAVRLRFACAVPEGVGVDPTDPPLVWEAFDGEDWSTCAVDSDGTGGLNQTGDVVLHVPDTHATALFHNLRAGWLRARVTAPREGQTFYAASPRVSSLNAATVGGTVPAVQAERVEDEVLGLSEGVPGQRFLVARPPVVPTSEALVLKVSNEDEGWEEWSEVADFSASGPDDCHFVLDPIDGEVRFGPAVRTADGDFVSYGAVPPKRAEVRLPCYHTGGGRRGNVAAGTVSVVRRSIPFVSRVVNRDPGVGGTDAEAVEEAMVRGPIALRALGRAVTAEDYQELAREAAPEAARVLAVAASDARDAGGVRVLVVPAVTQDDRGAIAFGDLVPPEELVRTVSEYLEERRTVGARVMVEPPAYQGVTVVAEIRARSWADPRRLRSAATEALYRYLNPLSGGPDGSGWPFGRPVHLGEVYAVLQRLPGTELVEDCRLFAADPVTGERGEAKTRVDVAPNALVFSYGHQVRVEEA